MISLRFCGSYGVRRTTQSIVVAALETLTQDATATLRLRDEKKFKAEGTLVTETHSFTASVTTTQHDFPHPQPFTFTTHDFPNLLTCVLIWLQRSLVIICTLSESPLRTFKVVQKYCDLRNIMADIRNYFTAQRVAPSHANQPKQGPAATTQQASSRQALR